MKRTITDGQIERLKRDAKALKRERSITHRAALDLVAKQQGYDDWDALQRARALSEAKTSIDAERDTL